MLAGEDGRRVFEKRARPWEETRPSKLRSVRCQSNVEAVRHALRDEGGRAPFSRVRGLPCLKLFRPGSRAGYVIMKSPLETVAAALGRGFEV